MIVLPEYGYPYAIDSVSEPIVPKYTWFYDTALNDFVLRPIRLLEETTGPAVLVQINNSQFMVPASWYLLVVDETTKLVDTVQIAECKSDSYEAFLMHPDESSYSTAPIALIDLSMQESCVHVMIPKQHMMLHPVGKVAGWNKSDRSYSCLLSTQDVGKNMNSMTAMEVLI